MIKIPAAGLFAVVLFATAASAQSGFEDEIRTNEDGTRFLVHPDLLTDGGPPKDGIPSIDEPRFTTVDEAGKFLRPDDLGVGIEYDGVKRFYPFRILLSHEIVNDQINGLPLLITYCPLCVSAIVFDRTIDGEAVEFGTTGKLFNSNLVMYDRKTDSRWTQVGGRAIIGELTGSRLKLFPAGTTTWQQYSAAHPDAQVLAKEFKGYRAYDYDPYEGRGYYTTDDDLMPGIRHFDDRLRNKAVVFGVNLDGVTKAWEEETIGARVPFEDEVNRIALRIERDAAGFVVITDLATGERIPYERDFWFAWVAFHPDTELEFDPNAVVAASGKAAKDKPDASEWSSDEGGGIGIVTLLVVGVAIVVLIALALVVVKSLKS